MIGVDADCPIEVGDGLLEVFQQQVGPRPLQIEPGTVRIEADRLGAIANGFLETVQLGVIQAGSHRAGPVVRRGVVREDPQPWRHRGASAGTAVGARPRAVFGFQSCGDETGNRPGAFVGQLLPLVGRRQQAPRREDMAASRSRSDGRLGRNAAELGVEPEPAEPDCDAQSDEGHAAGFQLPTDPPLAFIQQAAAEFVDLALQLDVAGVGGAGLPAVPAGRLPGRLRACPALGGTPQTLAARAIAASAFRVASLAQPVIVPRAASLKRRPPRRARAA